MIKVIIEVSTAGICLHGVTTDLPVSLHHLHQYQVLNLCLILVTYLISLMM